MSRQHRRYITEMIRQHMDEYTEAGVLKWQRMRNWVVGSLFSSVFALGGVIAVVTLVLLNTITSGSGVADFGQLHPATTTTTAPGTTTTSTTTAGSTTTTTTPAGTGTNGPASPAVINANICGNATYLQSPYATTGAARGTTTNVVAVTPGNAGSVSWSATNTTFYLSPGTYTNISSMGLGNNDWVVGEYSGGLGTVLDGGGTAAVAFEDPDDRNGQTHETIEYLTVQNYQGGSSGAVMGMGWSPQGSPYVSGSPGGMTFQYNTVQNTYPNSGVMGGSNDNIQYNCLTHNGDYGYNVYCSPTNSGVNTTAECNNSTLTNGPQNLTFQHNELSSNGLCDWGGIPTQYWPTAAGAYPSGCGSVKGSCVGCAGGFKFWATDGSQAVDNYVHDNYDGAGMWFDTDNDGATITNNYFSANFGSGIMYEISYNAKIDHNTFVDNGWGAGECGTSSTDNPCDSGSSAVGAIYISESGGNTNAKGNGGFAAMDLSNNSFIDNWGDIVAAQSPDRMCGPSTTNTSGYYCTLAANVADNPPSLGTYTSFWNQTGTPPSTTYYDNLGSTGLGCGQATLTGAHASPSPQNAQTPDYFDNCQWELTGLTSNNNTHNFDASHIQAVLPTSNTCSTNGFSKCGVAVALGSQNANYPSWNPNIPVGGSWGVNDRFTNCRPAHTYTGCVSQNNTFQGNAYTYTGSVPLSFIWVNGAGFNTNGGGPSTNFVTDWQGTAAQDSIGTYGTGGTGTTTTTAPATTTTVAPTTTTTAGGGGTLVFTHTSTSQERNDPPGTYWDSPPWRVSADTWQTGYNGTQALNVYNYNNWNIVTNDSNRNGQVQAYPHTRYWFTTPKTESSLTTCSTSWNFTSPNALPGQYDVAYDIWWNNYAQEMMVLVQWQGPSNWPSYMVTNESLGTGTGGANQAWGYTNGNGQWSASALQQWWDGATSTSLGPNGTFGTNSGTLNLLPIFADAVSHGFISASSTVQDFQFGVEISGTNGSQQFSLNNYTLNCG